MMQWSHIPKLYTHFLHCVCIYQSHTKILHTCMTVFIAYVYSTVALTLNEGTYVDAYIK